MYMMILYLQLDILVDILVDTLVQGCGFTECACVPPSKYYPDEGPAAHPFHG